MSDVIRILADIERLRRPPGGPQSSLYPWCTTKGCAAPPHPAWPARAPGRTLQPTALVHEAYLRLVGSEPDKAFDGRGHFFAAAAEAKGRKREGRKRGRS